MGSYDLLPSQAKSEALRPFTINIADTELERMRTLIKLSPVADPCYENSLPDGSRDLGIRREWLVEAKRVWEEFDWYVRSEAPKPHMASPVPRL